MDRSPNENSKKATTAIHAALTCKPITAVWDTSSRLSGINPPWHWDAKMT